MCKTRRLFALLIAVIASSSLNAQLSTDMLSGLDHVKPVFIKNTGQWDGQVLYRAFAGKATIWLTSEGISYQYVRPVPSVPGGNESANSARSSAGTMVVKTSFVGAKSGATVLGRGKVNQKTSFLIGADSSRWSRDTLSYTSVVYEQMYQGVDIEYFVEDGEMCSRWTVLPGVDPSPIGLRIDGTETVTIDTLGNLILTTAYGQIVGPKPTAFQRLDGEIKYLDCKYEIRDRTTVGVVMEEDYERNTPLTIEPHLVLTADLANVIAGEVGTAIVACGSGEAYITGYTTSSNFPRGPGYDTTYNGSGDAFVTKISVFGNLILYSTYIGGSAEDVAYGIAFDGNCRVVITGTTQSQNFPVVNAYDATPNGGRDVFVTKLSMFGDFLEYSTYLGGSGEDVGRSVIFCGNAEAYITGYTNSSNFPVLSAYDAAYNGGYDVFVAKLNIFGNSLMYSTYLGGTSDDLGYGVSVDGSCHAVVTGGTRSANFPIAGAYDPTYNGGWDVFISKLNAFGQSLDYSTFVGGSADEQARDISVFGNGEAYVAGYTSSSNFPVSSAFDSTYNGNTDAFALKLSVFGNLLQYSTFLGGSGADTAFSIAMCGNAYAYVGGSTASSNFPTLSGFDMSYNGGGDAFAAKLAEFGNSIYFSTFVGGSSADAAYGIAIDGSCNTLITGMTQSTNFPLLGALDGALTGPQEAFVTKILPFGNQLSYSTYLGGDERVPHIALSPTSLSFTAIQNGTRPLSKTFTISNTGGAILTWSVNEGMSWLDLTPLSGNSNTATVTASVNTTNLAPGTYTGMITTSSSNADNSPQAVNVTYIVNPPSPHISLSPASLSFTAVQNGSLPASKSFTIANSGGGTLNWTVTEGISWLDVSPSSGSSNSVAINVTLSTTNLTPNTYTGTIAVSSNNADNSPQNINVSYVVSTPNPHISVTPTALTFRGAQYGTLPSNQTILIQNSGTGTLNWAVSEGVPWIDISPASGSSNVATITASVNTTNLPLGSYAGTITVSSTNADNSPQTVDVNYDIGVTATRDIPLDSGWNLISWNLDTPSDSVLSLVSSILADVFVILGYDGGALTYDPQLPEFSTLSQMDHLHGYWFKMAGQRTLTITGTTVPNGTPISLRKGWNLISYLPDLGDSVIHALAPIKGKLSKVYGYSDSALSFVPGLEHFSTLQIMEPGFGYWLEMLDSATLTYPAVVLPISEKTVMSRTGRSLTPTSQWICVFEPESSKKSQFTLREGEVLTAYDPGGILCGQAEVGPGGLVMLMPIYRDDLSTPTDEGALPGDTINFKVDGNPVLFYPPIIWSVFGDVFQLFPSTDLCGDADASASVDISDAVSLIQYIFSGGHAPNPLLAGDANCDLAVDISDAVYLIQYIFSGGPAPCAACK